MKKILLFLLLSTPIITQAFPIDTTVFRYMPLNIGNRWVWNRVQNYSPGPGYESLKILGTQIINNKVYYQTRSDFYYIYNNSHYSSNGYCRIDSINGNLYTYDSLGLNGCLSDSLNSKKGDSAYSSCYMEWYKNDTGTYNIFNQSPKTKIFNWTYFEGGGDRIYAKNFGKVYESSQYHTASRTLGLQGCIVNGVLFGDTAIIVGINKISSEIPDKFSLSQNYPNPFNPSTKIKFAIPGSSAAQTFLSVYDVLGKEVTTLVNESLKPGSYEVEWDGSPFASGVYYYKLVVGDNNNGGFTETKKMVLIK